MRIAILAAGYGTRLYPLTLTTAKPLIPINGKPMVNFLFDKIERLRKTWHIEEVTVVVNNKFYDDFLRWKTEYRIGARIINDGSNSPDDRRGAVGDMRLALSGVSDDWLVLGGDNLFEDDLTGFVSYAKTIHPHPCLGLYDVMTKENAKRFGVVVVDSSQRVKEFQEKPEDPATTLAASCIYFFPKASVAYLDEYAEAHPNVDAAGTYIAWLAARASVYGYRLEGAWVDIGHADSLRQAEAIFGKTTKAKRCVQ